MASCTDISRFDISVGSIFVPTVGSQTHQDNCRLGVGNQSVAVQLLQWDINTCYGLNIAEDGIFGPQTEGAVQYVQALGGVTQDGIYGPVTRSIMRWYVFGPGACRLGF